MLTGAYTIQNDKPREYETRKKNDGNTVTIDIDTSELVKKAQELVEVLQRANELIDELSNKKITDLIYAK